MAYLGQAETACMLGSFRKSLRHSLLLLVLLTLLFTSPSQADERSVISFTLPELKIIADLLRRCEEEFHWLLESKTTYETHFATTATEGESEAMAERVNGLDQIGYCRASLNLDAGS